MTASLPRSGSSGCLTMLVIVSILLPIDPSLSNADLPPELVNSIEGRFIYVKIQVENRRRDAATMVSREVIDAQGRTYDEVAESRDLVEKSVFLFDTLQPSIPYEFEALFEVSASSNGLGIEVSNLQVDEHRSGIIALGL